MGLRINTNELSLAAQRNLEKTTNNLNSTIQRLASGSRIVHASDDAAGLAISEQINAQARSLGQAVRNAQDGVSLVQVYEGGTTEISNALVRLRELQLSSANDTIGDRERALIDAEVQQLTGEITRVAKTTKYNGKDLLSGSDEISLEFQVGINNDAEVDRIKFAPGHTDLTAGGLGIEGINALTKENAQGSLEVLDEAITRVAEIRAHVGASQSRLQTAIQAEGVFQENLTAAKARISDADIAKETATLTQQTILRQAGAAVLTQANHAPELALQLLRG